jgi:cell wall-associated NlpC family hydrolase
VKRRRKLAVGALVSALFTPGKVSSQTLEHLTFPPIPPKPMPRGTPISNPAIGAAQSATTTPTKSLGAAPFATFSASAASLRDTLVAMARAQIGRRYRLGGQSPETGFDCSGLVRYVMSALKVQVPRTASEQSRVGLAVERQSGRLRPGDLVTFGSTKRISHIGIYVGDGRFVHASTKAGRVIESPLIRPPNREIKPWRGVRRVIATPDSGVAVVGPKKG